MKPGFDADEINLIKLAKEYSDEDKARALLENLRWPEGATCPHCKAGNPYKLTPKPGSKTRKGLWKCRECRKQFTVTVGTVFEDSHIPISKWLMAIFILCSSKKAISAHQLHRMLDVTYKSAWFMAHRIRYAMGPDQPLGKLLQGTVEADEVYIGGKPRPENYGTGGGTPSRRGFRKNSAKVPVVALIERDGNVRTKVVAKVTERNLRKFITESVCPSSTMNTDQAGFYHNLLYPFARHDVVNHSIKEYARHNADGTISHVNSCESFFALLKRGVNGAWHHVSKEHLAKYVNEFAFRWNHRKICDGERMAKAVLSTEGKRLTYKPLISRK